MELFVGRPSLHRVCQMLPVSFRYQNRSDKAIVEVVISLFFHPLSGRGNKSTDCYKMFFSTSSWSFVKERPTGLLSLIGQIGPWPGEDKYLVEPFMFINV